MTRTTRGERRGATQSVLYSLLYIHAIKTNRGSKLESDLELVNYSAAVERSESKPDP
jgi:hypothetical protein